MSMNPVEKRLKNPKKQICTFKSVDVEAVEDRVLRFRASDATLDSDKDRLNPLGWKMRGESVPFQPFHNYNQNPLGKSVDVFVKDQGLYIDIRFPTAKELTEATGLKEEDLSSYIKEVNTVYALYKTGYLSAVSVGFKGLKGEPNEEGGINWNEMELWELSKVIIGANPNAQITDGKSAQIKVNPMGHITQKSAGEFVDTIDNTISELEALKEQVKWLQNGQPQVINIDESGSLIGDDEEVAQKLAALVEDEQEEATADEDFFLEYGEEKGQTLMHEQVEQDEDVEDVVTSKTDYFIEFTDIEPTEKSDDRWFMSFD